MQLKVRADSFEPGPALYNGVHAFQTVYFGYSRPDGFTSPPTEADWACLNCGAGVEDLHFQHRDDKSINSKTCWLERQDYLAIVDSHLTPEMYRSVRARQMPTITEILGGE